MKWIWTWLFKASAKKLMADFERHFPAQCPICSYQAYGLRNGYTTEPVKAHRCPENYARWNEAGTPKEVLD